MAYNRSGSCTQDASDERSHSSSLSQYSAQERTIEKGHYEQQLQDVKNSLKNVSSRETLSSTACSSRPTADASHRDTTDTSNGSARTNNPSKKRETRDLYSQMSESTLRRLVKTPMWPSTWRSKSVSIASRLDSGEETSPVDPSTVAHALGCSDTGVKRSTSFIDMLVEEFKAEREQHDLDNPFSHQDEQSFCDLSEVPVNDRIQSLGRRLDLIDSYDIQNLRWSQDRLRQKYQRLHDRSEEYLSKVEGEEIRDSMETLQYTFREVTCAVDNLDDRVKELETQMQSVIKQQEEIIQTTYTGQMVWKIDDVAAQKKQAVEFSGYFLQSPYFYTDAAGYKMYLRLYLNGLEVSEGFHVTVSLVVKKGEYDAVLQWPFSQMIKIALLDQSGTCSHFVKEKLSTLLTTRRQPSSPSDVRAECTFMDFCPVIELAEDPEGENTPGHGCYVKNDTMFIKVSVSSNIPYSSWLTGSVDLEEI